MDPKTVKHSKILRLIRQSDAARSCLAAEATVFRHRLDIPSRVSESLGKHPLAWLLGSIGSGLVASLLFRRKPSITEKTGRGIKLTLLGLAFTAVRPLLEAWLAGRLKNWAGSLVRFSNEPFSPSQASRNIQSR